jgi:hypothetical protein
MDSSPSEAAPTKRWPWHRPISERFYAYQDIERAIILALKCEPGEIGALRARIRYLRANGVPALKRVGSGRRCDYSFADAKFLFCCLLLQKAGLQLSAAIVLVRSSLEGSISTPIKTGYATIMLDLDACHQALVAALAEND